MTMAQPAAPPPPPAPGELEALRATNEALTQQVTSQALRQAAGALRGAQPEGRPGSVSVVRDEGGRVVVTTGDGRTVTYDPKVGLDEDAVQNMIQTALEPPRPPELPLDRVEPEKIVGIVFTFLFLMTVVIAVASVFRRRAAANAVTHAAPADLSARLARIEQAVEAVAIEVERISESERYSARLLTERLPEPAAPRLAETAGAPAAGRGA